MTARESRTQRSDVRWTFRLPKSLARRITNYAKLHTLSDGRRQPNVSAVIVMALTFFLDAHDKKDESDE